MDAQTERLTGKAAVYKYVGGLRKKNIDKPLYSMVLGQGRQDRQDRLIGVVGGVGGISSDGGSKMRSCQREASWVVIPHSPSTGAMPFPLALPR